MFLAPMVGTKTLHFIPQGPSAVGNGGIGAQAPRTLWFAILVGVVDIGPSTVLNYRSYSLDCSTKASPRVPLICVIPAVRDRVQ